MNKILNVQIDEQTVNAKLDEEIKKKVDELARQKYFLTYNQLSEYLNISKPVIEDRLIKNGMKYYRVGSKYLFKRDEVDAFLNEMTASMSATNNDIKFFNRLKAVADQ